MIIFKQFFSICVLLGFLFITNSAHANSTGKNNGRKNVPHPLRVGVYPGMPFVQNIDGHYSGIAIDIWEKTAKQNNWNYI